MWHGGGHLEHAGTSQKRTFWGMNQSLMERGFHAVFLDLGEKISTEEENAAREARHLRYVQEQGFGGALFYPYAYRSNRDLVEEVNRSVPLVMIDRKTTGVDLDFVGLRNYEALYETTRHLIEQGHRRIVHVTRFEPIRPVQDRMLGYIDAMRSANADEMIVHIPPYYDERTWNVFDALFRLPEGQRPTAVVSVSDYMAVGVAERLEHLGLAPAKDVALTGFDDIIPTLPNGMGLTTVAQPYEEIGSAAVDLLMRRINNPSAPPKSVELPARLVARASSALSAPH